MSEEEIKKEIEKIKPYLLSKGLDLELKHENDEIVFRFAKKGNLCCLLLNIVRFDKVLEPGDYGYPAQAEGMPIDSYEINNRRVFVFDRTGKIIIDQDADDDYRTRHGIHYRYIENDEVFLDEKNLLLPTTSVNSNGRAYQHFRIEDDKASLIHTFNENKPVCYDFLVNNQLIRYNQKLYNFLENRFLNHPHFDFILTPSDGWKLKECLNDCFRHMDINKEELYDFIKDAMKKGNVMFGYKEISVKKEDIAKNYFTFTYLDNKANISSSLFYSDGSELKLMEVSNETYDDAINILQSDLSSRIDEELERRTKKDEIYQTLIEEETKIIKRLLKRKVDNKK